MRLDEYAKATAADIEGMSLEIEQERTRAAEQQQATEERRQRAKEAAEHEEQQEQAEQEQRKQWRLKQRKEAKAGFKLYGGIKTEQQLIDYIAMGYKEYEQSRAELWADYERLQKGIDENKDPKILLGLAMKVISDFMGDDTIAIKASYTLKDTDSNPE